MICEHPQCNGKHAHTFRVAERCPAARERKRAADREYSKAYRPAHWLGDPVICLLRNSRHRAKTEGVPFDLARATVPPLPGHCPCCGITLDRKGGWRHQPSLDRRVPALGYVVSNVQWLCRRCNQIKSNATAAELMRVATFMEAGQCN